MTRVALASALTVWAALTAPFAAGVSDGRRGVERLVAAEAATDSAAAAEAFTAGLDASPPRWARARLSHNLGLALFAGRPGAADSAFADAVAHADHAADRAVSARHAGLAALDAGDAPRAVAHLRRALLLAPDDADAQRAYEIARRRADGPGAPTPEALRIKAEADRLVAARRYTEALALVAEARTRVPSLAAFDDWAARVRGVAEIVDAVPPGTTAAPDRVPAPPPSPAR